MTRFSAVAFACVVALVATGVVQTWRVLPGGLGDLTSTDYGRTLLVKLVFVAGLVALGWGAGAWWPAGCSVRRCGARWRPRW